MTFAIVRPSGVWNTRAPLHYFLSQSIELQKTYALLTGAIARTRYDADHITSTETSSAAKFMYARVAGPVASKAWNSYRWAWRALNGTPSAQPSIKEVEYDLGICLYGVREYLIVKYSGMFESFVQCWALNMLLAFLEQQQNLSRAQEKLAEDFSPVDKAFVRTPGVPEILRAFPNVRNELSSMPHITLDPETKEPVEVPVSGMLNALNTIKFWRDFRNHVVHRGSRISTSFAFTHAAFFDQFREPYGNLLRPLEYGRRLQLPNVLYYALATTHQKVALRLNQHLQQWSGDRRGNIYLPEEGIAEPTQFASTARPRPMLIEGDHVKSFSFVNQFSVIPINEEDGDNYAQPFVAGDLSHKAAPGP